MSTRSGDEFAEVFDHLTMADFTPARTLTYPSEDPGFEEFVKTRLESARLALVPGKRMLHAILSNGVEVRQLAPRPRERVHQLIERTTLNARDMMAHSLFFCSIAEVPDLGKYVVWYAGRIDDGTQINRMGLISITGGRLGDYAEVQNPEVLTQASMPFQGVLMP